MSAPLSYKVRKYRFQLIFLAIFLLLTFHFYHTHSLHEILTPVPGPGGSTTTTTTNTSPNSNNRETKDYDPSKPAGAADHQAAPPSNENKKTAEEINAPPKKPADKNADQSVDEDKVPPSNNKPLDPPPFKNENPGFRNEEVPGEYQMKDDKMAVAPKPPGAGSQPPPKVQLGIGAKPGAAEKAKAAAQGESAVDSNKGPLASKESDLPGSLKAPSMEDFFKYEVITNAQPPTRMSAGKAGALELLPRILKLPRVDKFPVKSVTPLPKPDFSNKIPKIQAESFKALTGVAESTRLERLDAIKKAFLLSWNQYKEHAWGKDEIKPVSQEGFNPFAGWSATLVDALDTLYIMDLKDDFKEALAVVKDIDFTTTFRKDIPLFETVIRYLGGLLSAYDLSKEQVLLAKAIELGDNLMGAFDTPNRMPKISFQWTDSAMKATYRASAGSPLAEVGSLSVEFTRLAQVSGNDTYYDAIDRITTAIYEMAPKNSIPYLFNLKVDASGCKLTNLEDDESGAEQQTLKAPSDKSVAKAANAAAKAASAAIALEADQDSAEYSKLIAEKKAQALAGKAETAALGGFKVKRGTQDADEERSSEAKQAAKVAAQKALNKALQDDEDVPKGKAMTKDEGLKQPVKSTAEQNKAVKEDEEELPKGKAMTKDEGLKQPVKGLVMKEDDDDLPKGKAMTKDEGLKQPVKSTAEQNKAAKEDEEPKKWVVDPVEENKAPKKNDELKKTAKKDPVEENKAPKKPVKDEEVAGQPLKKPVVGAAEDAFLKKTGDTEDTESAKPAKTPVKKAKSSKAGQGKTVISTYSNGRSALMQCADQPALAPYTSELSYYGGLAKLANELGLKHPPKYTIGGLTDSTYEYFAKEHLLLHGADPRYKELHTKTIDAISKNLLFRPMVEGDPDILFAGNLYEPAPGFLQEDNEMTHLSCFAGGMFAMGGKIFDRPEDVETGIKLTQGCVWAYNITRTGVMPENFHVRRCPAKKPGDDKEPECHFDFETVFTETAAREKKMLEELKKKGIDTRGKGATTLTGFQKEVEEVADGRGGTRWPMHYYYDMPRSFLRMDAKYIMRPEALESVFYMYRITGDPVWQDRAWNMITSILKLTEVKAADGSVIAYSGVHDVTDDRATKGNLRDEAESFWMAETLKYAYLVFSKPELVSLDEYVFNTEGHPVLRPVEEK